MTASPDAAAADHGLPPAVRATVPASSANLGPGFDVLAIALDLTLDVTAVPYEGRRVVATGEGVGELSEDDDNLVWRALVTFCEDHDVAVPDVTLHCRSRIPLERGLGSSSAAAVAGLVLARHLTGVAVGDDNLVTHASRLEGHPDNAAAAVLGGLVVAGDGPTRRFEPTRGLRPIACVPQQRSATSAARGLVPSDVAVSTLVGAARGTALVLAGLAGMAAWDPAVMRDAVHEPPRLAAMPATRRLVDALRAAGDGACLSGAGPSILVVVPADDRGAVDRVRRLAGDGWRVLALAWDRAGARVDVRPGSAS
ncbi:MAG TPA: homoserine kinase [Euzebyales bacterium]